MTDEDDSDTDDVPGAAIEAPWEEGAPAEGPEEPRSESGPSQGAELSRWDHLTFLVPRFLALVVFVGIPATFAYLLFVARFQLDPLFQIIGLLGFAYLVRWALRPHLDRYFTHPANREE